MAHMVEVGNEYDCMILYDDANRWNDADKIISKIKHFMENVPISITLPQQQILPGDDIITRLATEMTKADIAILLIASVPSKLFLDLIDRVKSRNLRLIPLFCDMSKEEAERIVNEEIPILGITEICINHEEYLIRLQKVIEAKQDLTNKLKLAYRKIKGNTSTLFSRSFLQSADIPFIFVPPTCDVERINKDGESSYYTNDMLEAIGKADQGDRIIIHASAGMGKTYTATHCAVSWQEGDPRLTNYQHVFFLPVKKMRNRSEVIERVICHDLHIVPELLASNVRLALRDTTTRSLIIIDGYDELKDEEKEESIVTQIISGDKARTAVVVITTRPESIPSIQRHVKVTCIKMSMRKLNQQGIYLFVEQFFPGDYKSFKLVFEDLMKDFHIFFSLDFVSTPFFLAIVCYICKISIHICGNLDTLYNMKTTGSLISTFWGHIIRTKDTSEMNIDLSLGLFDRNTKPGIKYMMNAAAKMSFDCLEMGQYIFTDEILKRHLTESDVCPEYLGKLGPVEFVEGGIMFSHKLLQEYCAALYLARDSNAQKQVWEMYKLRNENMAMFEKYRNALIFAVEIRPELMDNFHIEEITIPLLYSEREYRLDLSLESEMVNACKNKPTALNFVARLLQASVSVVQNVDVFPVLNLKAYKDLLSYMTHADCLALLRKAFPYDVNKQDAVHEAPYISPSDGSTFQKIGDPIILTSLLSVNLGNTRRLALSNIKPSTFKFLKDDPECYGSSLEEIIISAGSAVTEWQLGKLVDKLTFSGKLNILRLNRQSSIVKVCRGFSKEESNALKYKHTNVDLLIVETNIQIGVISALTTMMTIDALHLVSTCKSKVGAEVVFTGCNLFVYDWNAHNLPFHGVNKVVLNNARWRHKYTPLRYLCGDHVRNVIVENLAHNIDPDTLTITGLQKLDIATIQNIFPNARITHGSPANSGRGDDVPEEEPLTKDMIKPYWFTVEALEMYRRKYGIKVPPRGKQRGRSSGWNKEQ